MAGIVAVREKSRLLTTVQDIRHYTGDGAIGGCVDVYAD
ncbi:hypothetical protein BN2497_3209 [Janthinobacterium sp. CG23_2]|nr:hypothetical protein BN2497_3209 [Janthinobacterium sp. CG23_2]CUU28002.1 hypothetical protein BN3177_3209 [Janthinobacterium sp. CG23_2]